MHIKNKLKKAVLEVSNKNFDDLALQIFRFQSKNNSIYNQYLNYLGINPDKIKKVNQIPFLPISFFKSHKVSTGEFSPKVVFESSGTTGSLTSRHYLEDTQFYHQISSATFNKFYGSLNDYHIFALLPSYLERGNSSLVYMVNNFIQDSKPNSGFYLNEFDELLTMISKVKTNQTKIILIGVTFALLDLLELFRSDLSGVIIMETGGMKGRRKEMIREELHSKLIEGFNVPNIHSEYGMTELLSQAYSKGDGIFYTSPWLKILLRDINDPFSVSEKIKSGGINIIDLANIDSCCFIETQDIGNLDKESSGFRVLGRFDNSDIRGCNLLIS